MRCNVWKKYNQLQQTLDAWTRELKLTIVGNTDFKDEERLSRI
jgi:hypothetical protein